MVFGIFYHRRQLFCIRWCPYPPMERQTRQKWKI